MHVCQLVHSAYSTGYWHYRCSHLFSTHFCVLSLFYFLIHVVLQSIVIVVKVDLEILMDLTLSSTHQYDEVVFGILYIYDCHRPLHVWTDSSNTKYSRVLFR